MRSKSGALICHNRNDIRETLKLSQARLRSPTVEQYASLVDFGAPPAYLENVKAEYEKRHSFIVKSLRSIPGVKCSRPNGAFYLIAQLPVEDAEDFAIFINNVRICDDCIIGAGVIVIDDIIEHR